MASRRKQRKAGDARGHEVPARSGTRVPAGIPLRATLIVLAGIIAYANSLSGPFVLDDQDTIVMNEQIRQLSPSVVLFPAVELPVAGRPVVNVTFALNYALGGLAVGGYHAVNIALHIASALLLFGVVRRTLDLIAGRPSTKATGDNGTTSGPFPGSFTPQNLAFATAILWLVHPLQTDAVDYITQRTELVMGMFYMLTLYASIRAFDQATWFVVAVVSCALGMASKESMVTAPFLVVMYDRIFVFDSFREAWRRRSGLYLSLAATWLVLASVVWSGPRFRSAGFSAGVSVWTYLLNQAQMIPRYLRLAFWPNGLVVDYGAPRAIGLGDVMPQAGLVCGLLALTIWALLRKPMIGFLGLWFFTTLSPTSSVVPIATEVGAERRMYLPLAAVVMLAIVGVAWLLERARMRGLSSERAQMAGAAALAVVVILLGGATLVRNREYASAVTLARSTFERWPTARAQHSLGAALVADMQYEEGIRQLTEAVNGDPGARYTLGVALYQQGKPGEAIVQLREFLARESLRIEVPTAHELVGRALRAQGRYVEAAEEFQRVLAMTPGRREVHGLLAESLMRQQKYGEAVGHFQQLLAYRPNDISALMQLGISLINLGRLDEAIVQFRRVVELNPRDGVANRNLARALLERGSFDEAALYAKEATVLLPGDAVAHDQLGVALANVGRLDEGIVELQRAAQLDPADPEVRAHLAAALQAKQNPKRGP